MINGLYHIALSTPDIDRTVAFYTDVLGSERVGWIGGWEAGDAVIDEIVGLENSAAGRRCCAPATSIPSCSNIPRRRRGSPMRTGRSAITATRTSVSTSPISMRNMRLSAAGMRFHRAPLTDPEQGIAGTYGRDPDGNVIEIQEVRPPEHVFHRGKLAAACQDVARTASARFRSGAR